MSSQKPFLNRRPRRLSVWLMLLVLTSAMLPAPVAQALPPPQTIAGQEAPPGFEANTSAMGSALEPMDAAVSLQNSIVRDNTANGVNRSTIHIYNEGLSGPDLDAVTRPRGVQYDMGTFELWCASGVTDVDGSGKTDIVDVGRVAGDFLDASHLPQQDINCDGTVDLGDITLVAAAWAP